MHIQFYGGLADRLGRSINLDLPEAIRTVADLRQLLGEAYPDSAGEITSGALKACIGDEIVGDAHDLHRTDMVEFFPPLSGG